MALRISLYIEVFSIMLSSRGEPRNCMGEKPAGVLAGGSEIQYKAGNANRTTDMWHPFKRMFLQFMLGKRLLMLRIWVSETECFKEYLLQVLVLLSLITVKLYMCLDCSMLAWLFMVCRSYLNQKPLQETELMCLRAKNWRMLIVIFIVELTAASIL